MTLHNAHAPSPLPKVIKTAAFSDLIEQEVKALRTYDDLNDPDIDDGEVFLYGANVQPGMPEGDDFADHRQNSTAAGRYETNRRTKDEQLVQVSPGHIGSQEVKKPGIFVYWRNPTVSPVEDQLVQARAI